MKYIASEIVKRALNLADMSNTSFITHKENIQYLNDAWNRQFNWIVNKGIKQFVKEVALESCSSSGDWVEYYLPDDCYKILSIKNPYSGSILIRQAETEGINSGCYDVVNNKIRLYGVNNSNLLMTYYVTPTYITYPDEDIDETDLIGKDYTVLSIAGNSALINLDTTYTIVSLTDGSTVADVSWLKDISYTNIALGNGLIFVDTSTYNFDGDVVDSSFTEHKFIYDNHFNIYGLAEDGYTLNYITYDSDTIAVWDDEPIIATDESTLTYNDVDYEFSQLASVSLIVPAESVDDIHPTFTVKIGTSFYQMIIGESEIELYKIETSNKIIMGVGAKGLLTTNGTYLTYESNIPDTAFDFPNDLYISLIAIDLAVRYAIKLNAKIDGLDNMMVAAQTDFMNSLDQSGSYTRIKNIYH